jgi:hypothetical protein
VDVKKEEPAPFVFTGTTAFMQAGFQKAARNSPARPALSLFDQII